MVTLFKIPRKGCRVGQRSPRCPPCYGSRAWDDLYYVLPPLQLCPDKFHQLVFLYDPGQHHHQRTKHRRAR